MALTEKEETDAGTPMEEFIKNVEEFIKKGRAMAEKGLSDEEAKALAEEAPPGGGVLLRVKPTEVTDIGEFCVDCRDPVDERYPKFASRRPVIREGEGEDGKALKGFLCEDCVPLEGTLMQPLVDALVERRWPEADVKERMRIVGVEDIYEKVVGPTLDLLEVLLRLER